MLEHENMRLIFKSRESLELVYYFFSFGLYTQTFKSDGFI